MSPYSRDADSTRFQNWLCALLSDQLKIPAGQIDPVEPLSTYGLDSVTAIAVLADVEDHVGFDIDPNTLWEFPTVSALSDLLFERMTRSDLEPQA